MKEASGQLKREIKATHSIHLPWTKSTIQAVNDERLFGYQFRHKGKGNQNADPSLVGMRKREGVRKLILESRWAMVARQKYLSLENKGERERGGRQERKGIEEEG